MTDVQFIWQALGIFSALALPGNKAVNVAGYCVGWLIYNLLFK